ncbi:MAG: aminotransferase class I/II-fold pyridoxal phosphate-dependent enzyme [Clostridia bacterium]|nr:aminotransferase class I/II-fold pyridoxal phosphate-dependent enzyme [Clostridia bacterium]MBQ5808675.1 aminotransferase class I/II-fold pyridoxal phosphate-dependent enzyme [Clostridia bacterium]
MFDPTKVISKKCADIKPSGIRKFFDLLETMPDVVSLTVGQPDFVTPWKIREAAIESIEKGRTYYTSNAGTQKLRDALSDYLTSFDLHYDPKKEIIVTCGGSEAVDAAIRALVDEGDEVIVHSPNFVCYEPLVNLCGGKCVTIETVAEEDFKVTPEKLRAAISPKTKLLVLSYPNNPTGAVMEREDLEALANVIKDTDICVLSDEIYAELTYGQKHVSIASLPGMRERTVVVSGFSKAFAMTGWRLGYACAPKEIASQILKIHQYAIMCASTASQFAGIEALTSCLEAKDEMVREYDRRRKFVVNELQNIGLKCYVPKGAFYVFPDIRVSGLTSDQFAEKLLFEYKACVVPGNAFGDCGEGFVRISYAYSVDHIKEGISRIGEMLKSL